MSEKFFEAVKTRRSNYSITKSSPIPDEKIIQIVNDTIQHVPSGMNLVPTRLVLLLEEQHDKFWKTAYDVTKVRLPEDQFEGPSKRIEGFAAAYGTILFFHDVEASNELGQKHPGLAAKLPQFAEHTNAMCQFVAWTALTLEGFGCNIQHYNPYVDPKVQETWNVPASWCLTGQLVFGAPSNPPKKKTFKPLDDKVLVFR
ncbi:putative nitroreductase family protein [Leptodontidium sp. MPI-SDFR-AT-0119]|nr:putative nitroreductase family protein [Leptodontidium sp. MPI-SDFR-AT-0119]